MRKDTPHTIERKAARAVAEGDGAALYEFFNAVQHSHPRAYISNFTVTAAQYRGLESFKVLF